MRCRDCGAFLSRESEELYRAAVVDPSRTEWFVAHRNQQFGPFAATELQAAFRENRVPMSALVWKHGLEEWMPAHQVSELWK